MSGGRIGICGAGYVCSKYEEQITIKQYMNDWDVCYRKLGAEWKEIIANFSNKADAELFVEAKRTQLSWEEYKKRKNVPILSLISKLNLSNPRASGRYY